PQTPTDPPAVPLEAGRPAQLHPYRGPLAGLLTVEVEFDSTAEATAFEPPDWFGTDVTGRSEYNNRNLCLRGTPPTEEPTA
ncbi:hypothetical protein ACFV4F_40815, partial [Kitasatospora sp. NPDC059722]